MKGSKIGLVVVLFVIIAFAVGISRELYASDNSKGTIAGVDQNKFSDDGDKVAIIANQAKIDQEREAILADGRKLREIKKSGDKALIEQASKEIAEDIKKRKATIRSLKDDIQSREAGPSVPSGRRRAK